MACHSQKSSRIASENEKGHHNRNTTFCTHRNVFICSLHGGIHSWGLRPLVLAIFGSARPLPPSHSRNEDYFNQTLGANTFLSLPYYSKRPETLVYFLPLVSPHPRLCGIHATPTKNTIHRSTCRQHSRFFCRNLGCYHTVEKRRFENAAHTVAF